MVNDIRLVFVIDALRAGERELAAQRIHLIVIRTLLYFCYQDAEVLWGHLLFNSGTVQLTYRKTLFKSVTVDGGDQLLNQLVAAVSSKSGGSKNGPGPTSSWEHVLNSALTDLPWDDSFTNYVFILSTEHPAISTDRQKTLVKSFAEHKITFVHIDLNWVWGTHMGTEQPGLVSSLSSILIPSSSLSSHHSYLWFQEVLRHHLTRQPSVQPKIIPFSQYSSDFDTKLCYISPVQGVPCEVKSVVLGKVVTTEYASLIDHSDSYFIVMEEELDSSTVQEEGDSEELVTSQVTLLASPHNLLNITSPHPQQQIPSPQPDGLLTLHNIATSSAHVTIHYSNDESKAGVFTPLAPHLGILYCLTQKLEEIGETVAAKEQFTFHSLYDTEVDVNNVMKTFKGLGVGDGEGSECSEGVLLEQLAEHHNTVREEPTAVNMSHVEDSSKDSEHDIDLIEEALRGKVSRASLTSLFAKCGKGKEDLSTPSVLKERYSVGDETLVKEHKIQIMLQLLLFAEEEEKTLEQTDLVMSDVMALLRSLSFITDPTVMYKFLGDEIVPQYCEDCTTLLRLVYEDGLLTEPPALLRDSDEESMNSSVMSIQAPLYCEDSQSSMSNDLPSVSSSQPFSKRKSWIDPCTSSQSSFSITIPKLKKIKERRRNKDHIVASKVWKKKISDSNQGTTDPFTKVTPTELRQSSKRRKLSRKNSVLDTPLKKQVANPINAQQNRARQRVELTPQKTTPVIHVQESPVRVGKASSFFGLKPPAYPNQGFKTPTRPSRPSQDKTPSSSKINLDKTPSLFDSSRDSSPNNTPPGTPKHERRFVKKLSYSPMRDIFKGEENSNSSIGYLMTPPKRKPLGTDYIYMMSSPCRDKENEPFFPCINSLDKLGLDSIEQPQSTLTQYKASVNTLEPIFDQCEEAQMPFYSSSPPSALHPVKELGFLKMLQESPGYVKSDDETSLCSDSSQLQGILKSPFNRRKHSRRRVSFSFNDEYSNMFSSDNESEGGHRVMDLLDIVDDSIRNDGGFTSVRIETDSTDGIREGIRNTVVDSQQGGGDSMGGVRDSVGDSADGTKGGVRDGVEDSTGGGRIGEDGMRDGVAGIAVDGMRGGVVGIAVDGHDVVDEFRTKKRKRLVSAEYDDIVDNE